MITKPNFLNLIGLVFLILLFFISSGRMILLKRQAERPGHTIIRLAHIRLQAPFKAAIDRLAADYMKLHPNVTVKQIPIPLRIWRMWVRTQLAGGTAPELIFDSVATNDELLVRHFVPLTPWVDLPNTYNKGTALEGVPWRETFLNGLNNPPTYKPDLMEVYSVPTSMSTLRLLYNVDLLETVTNSREPPTTWEAFLALCSKVEAFAQRENRVLFPMAGSDRSIPLFTRMFSRQTQRLTLAIDRDRTLERTRWKEAYLLGEWNLRSDGIKGGLKVLRRLGLHTNPGFINYRIEDQSFYFLQQRALAVPVFAQMESKDLRDLAGFAVDVMNLPDPAHDNAEFAPNTLGPNSEAGMGMGQGFNVLRGPHVDVAVDFLHYMTSRRAYQTFVEISHSIPVVIGVEPPEGLRKFMPKEKGFPPGFLIGGSGNSGTEAERLFRVNFHLLADPTGSVDSFIEALERDYGKMLLADQRNQIRSWTRNIQRNDTVLAARASLLNPGDQKKAFLLLEMQNSQELALYKSRNVRRKTGHLP